MTNRLKRRPRYNLDFHNRRFDTEEKCHDYLVRVRWNGRPQCPVCGNDNMNYYLSSRKVFKCKGCYKQFSVIKGTIFEGTKLPLKVWFLAIYLFTTKKRGLSSYQLSKWLGVKQHTAWSMLHRLREALREENDILLGGIVEADETFVGPKISRDTRLQREMKRHYAAQDTLYGMTKEKARNHRGYPAKRGRKKGSTKEVLQQKKLDKKNKIGRVPYERYQIVLGLKEQRGRVVLKNLGSSRASINKDNILPHVRKHISGDSIFITDRATLYEDSIDMFQEHRTVNHNEGYVIDGVHINNVENVWHHLKKTIDGTYFHIAKHHFSAYLNEHTYRWNRRDDSERSIFDTFITLVSGKRLSYEDLVHRKTAA